MTNDGYQPVYGPFSVLDVGFVECLNVMGSDNSIVSAARASRLGKSKGEEADRQLLRFLMENGHTSPFEHVVFSFRVKAPLMVTQQWMRHRTWSFNSSSARYKEHLDLMLVSPSQWRKPSNSPGCLLGAGIDDITEAFELSNELVAHYVASKQLYQRAIEAGVAREQARVFLPGFALYYTFVATVDAHNLMHFLKQRMVPAAQHEIRRYAETIYFDIFKKHLPWTAEVFEDSIHALSYRR